MPTSFTSCGGLKTAVSAVSFTAGTVPHGIKFVSETETEWTVYITGLVVGDSYEFDVEFDDESVQTIVFEATDTFELYVGEYEGGATKVVRVEFNLFFLPIEVTYEAYTGFGGRVDATEFYDILENLVP